MHNKNLPALVLPTDASVRLEAVRKRFSKGKFVTTKTAFIKLLAIIILFIGSAVFIAKPICEETSIWYGWLYPSSCIATLTIVVILYLCFALGYAKNNPQLWISIDICLSLILSILVIIVSVLTMTNCSETASLHKVPGPLGFSGAGTLIISTAAIFLLYRYEPVTQVPNTPAPITPRVKEDVFA